MGGNSVIVLGFDQ